MGSMGSTYRLLQPCCIPETGEKSTLCVCFAGTPLSYLLYRILWPAHWPRRDNVCASTKSHFIGCLGSAHHPLMYVSNAIHLIFVSLKTAARTFATVTASLATTRLNALRWPVRKSALPKGPALTRNSQNSEHKDAASCASESLSYVVSQSVVANKQACHAHASDVRVHMRDAGNLIHM